MGLFGNKKTQDEDDLEIQDDLTIEDEDAAADTTVDDTTTTLPQVWQPDEAFMDSLADRVAMKVRPPAAEKKEAVEGDPYAEAEALYYSDGLGAALRKTAEIATAQALKGVEQANAGRNSFTDNLAAGQALAEATKGLDEHGEQFVHDFLKEKEIDPRLLSDPVVADLVRSKAELHQMKRSGAHMSREIPNTESSVVAGINVDPETRKELSGIERMAAELGIKVTPEHRQQILRKAGMGR